MDLLDTAFGDTGSRMVHHRVFGKSAPDGGIVSLVWAKVRYVAADRGSYRSAEWVLLQTPSQSA
jgi:hypothetical protein